MEQKSNEFLREDVCTNSFFVKLKINKLTLLQHENCGKK